MHQKFLIRYFYLQGTPGMTAEPAVSIATSSSLWYGQSQLTSNHEGMAASLWFLVLHSERNTKN